MLAYKGFDKGLICRGYQFHIGLNTTPEANCVQNGFHCAENPLDCLDYYSNMNTSEYYVVNVGGDVDEDNRDSKISCTELTIIRQISNKELILHGLAFMEKYPQRKWNSRVKEDHAKANYGLAIARGIDPLVKGENTGDILGIVKESEDRKTISQIALAIVDGKTILPDVWYDVNFKEREDLCFA